MLNFVLEGSEHFTTEPVGTDRNLLIADHEFSGSMKEKWGSPRHELILDRLSDREKVGTSVILFYMVLIFVLVLVCILIII